jgi:hypothetical protein
MEPRPGFRAVGPFSVGLREAVVKFDVLLVDAERPEGVALRW